MVTAYTTALPASVLPAIGSAIVAVGSPLLVGVVVAAFAVAVAATLQWMLPAHGPAPARLRVVGNRAAAGASREAA